MKEPITKVPFHDMAIVHCPTNENNMAVLNKLNVNNNLFRIMSCSNQIWMGTKKDFSTLPGEFKKKYFLDGSKYYLEGDKAYSFALEYLLGMHGKADGENNVVSQTKEAWSKFSSSNPDRAQSLEPIWSSLLHDSRAIRAKITSQLKPVRIENTAVRAAGQDENQTALIVGGVTSKMKIEDIGSHLIRHLGNKRKGRPSKILFTTPEDLPLEHVQDCVDNDKKTGHIHCEVKAVPFDDFVEKGLHEPKMVFITFPMGRSADIDGKLIEATNIRAGMSQRTIHLRDNPTANGAWEEGTKDLLGYYTSPKDLRNLHKLEIEKNDKIKEAGRLACHNCAVSRVMHDKKPVYSFLALPTEEYLHKSGIDKSSSTLNR